MLPAVGQPRRWWVPAAVFAIALGVYLATLPAGLTWANDSADGGDLIAAALVTGVAHPTGYPTFTLLARLATVLPWGTPAWRVALLSACCGALTATFVTATVLALGRPAAEGGQLSIPVPALQPGWAGPAPAVAVGLMLAFSPLLWGQSTVAEVYALLACLAAALSWAVVRWQQSGSPTWAAALGLLSGLALGNHLTILALAPMVAVVLLQERGRRRALVTFVLALAAGLLVTLYLPLAASTSPPVNWGDPQTLDGFLWLVSGQLYRPFVFAAGWPDVLARLQAWVGLVWQNFLPWGVALALAGLLLLAERRRTLAVATLASLALGLIWSLAYDTTDSYLALLPGWVLIAIWIGVGLQAAAHRWAGAGAWGSALILALCGALILVPLVRYWPAQDLSQDRQAEDFMAAVLATAEPAALVVTAGDRATFSLWYGRYGLGRRPDLAPVSRDLWGLESYRRTVGHTHPDLAGPQPPADWPTFLATAALQHPIYFAEAPGSGPPPTLANLGLLPDAPYRLDTTPVAGLWRLQPLSNT
jgi:hypothetical protein